MIWINVKDAIPEIHQKVLFTWKIEGHQPRTSMGYRCKDGWNIYLPYHSYGLNPDCVEVSYWMDLPEPPE